MHAPLGRRFFVLLDCHTNSLKDSMQFFQSRQCGERLFACYTPAFQTSDRALALVVAGGTRQTQKYFVFDQHQNIRIARCQNAFNRFIVIKPRELMFIFCQPQHRAQIELVLEFAQTALTPKGYCPSHGDLQDWPGIFIQCAGNRVLQLSAISGQVIVQPLKLGKCDFTMMRPRMTGKI